MTETAFNKYVESCKRILNDALTEEELIMAIDQTTELAFDMKYKKIDSELPHMLLILELIENTSEITNNVYLHLLDTELSHPRLFASDIDWLSRNYDDGASYLLNNCQEEQPESLIKDCIELAEEEIKIFKMHGYHWVAKRISRNRDLAIELYLDNK